MQFVVPLATHAMPLKLHVSIVLLTINLQDQFVFSVLLEPTVLLVIIVALLVLLLVLVVWVQQQLVFTALSTTNLQELSVPAVELIDIVLVVTVVV